MRVLVAESRLLLPSQVRNVWRGSGLTWTEAACLCVCVGLLLNMRMHVQDVQSCTPATFCVKYVMAEIIKVSIGAQMRCISPHAFDIFSLETV